MDVEEAHPMVEVHEVCDSLLLTVLYFMPRSL